MCFPQLLIRQQNLNLSFQFFSLCFGNSSIQNRIPPKRRGKKIFFCISKTVLCHSRKSTFNSKNGLLAVSCPKLMNCSAHVRSLVGFSN